MFIDREEKNFFHLTFLKVGVKFHRRSHTKVESLLHSQLDENFRQKLISVLERSRLRLANAKATVHWDKNRKKFLAEVKS